MLQIRLLDIFLFAQFQCHIAGWTIYFGWNDQWILPANTMGALSRPDGRHS